MIFKKGRHDGVIALTSTRRTTADRYPLHAELNEITSSLILTGIGEITTVETTELVVLMDNKVKFGLQSTFPRKTIRKPPVRYLWEIWKRAFLAKNCVVPLSGSE